MSRADFKPNKVKGLILDSLAKGHDYETIATQLNNKGLYTLNGYEWQYWNIQSFCRKTWGSKKKAVARAKNLREYRPMVKNPHARDLTTRGPNNPGTATPPLPIAEVKKVSQYQSTIIKNVDEAPTLSPLKILIKMIETPEFTREELAHTARLFNLKSASF